MKRIFSIILSFFFLTGVSQNSIKGRVTAIENGVETSLEGVNIYWLKTTIGTISKGDGSFEIEKVDLPASLVFQYLGFETDTLLVANGEFITHQLRTVIAEELDEVVVSKTNCISRT